MRLSISERICLLATPLTWLISLRASVALPAFSALPSRAFASIPFFLPGLLPGFSTFQCKFSKSRGANMSFKRRPPRGSGSRWILPEILFSWWSPPCFYWLIKKEFYVCFQQKNHFCFVPIFWRSYGERYQQNLELNHNKFLWKFLWLICVRKRYLESFSLCHNAGFLSRLISSKTACTKSAMVEQMSAREEEQRQLQSYCQSRPWADEQKTGERWAAGKGKQAAAEKHRL